MKVEKYLTPSLFRPNCPHPKRGGLETTPVMIQIKKIVIMVERGVESGNCRSFVTIMYLKNKKTIFVCFIIKSAQRGRILTLILIGEVICDFN